MWIPIRTRTGPCRKRLLRGGGGGDRVRGSGERDEEGVALRVDLDAAVAVDRLADDAVVLGQRRRRSRRPARASSRVEPSMSVKRKVTVPVGSSRTAVQVKRLGAESSSPGRGYGARAPCAR